MSTSSFERDNSELTPVTASIGFNDGANKGFWRVQPRQKTGKKRGRWIEMGAELRAYFKNALGEAAAASGRAIGSDGTPDGVRVYITGYADQGIPDGIYGFKTKDVMVAEALLPDEYVEGKGLAAKIPSDIDVANLPNIEDLERVDITPDDVRLANEGINTPEGQEMSKFKDSPEGQEIARLDEETAEGVQQGIEDVPLNERLDMSPKKLAAIEEYDLYDEQTRGDEFNPNDVTREALWSRVVDAHLGDEEAAGESYRKYLDRDSVAAPAGDSVQNAMQKAIAEALGGGTPDLDKTIEAARRPSIDDDEDINLDEFDEADGLDEFDEPIIDTNDPEFQQTPIAKENVAAEDLQMDDFISVGGQTLKVVGLQYNDDDSVTVRAANADGFVDEFERSDYNLITEFGTPKQKPKAAPKAAPKPVPEAAPTPTPAPKPARKAKPKAAPKAAEPTPETAPEPTPVPEAAPTVSLPENATRVNDVNDLQYGDMLYTQDGLELGKFLGIESKGPSGTTVKVSKNGTVRPLTLTGRKPLFMTREAVEEETPTPTPTPTPTNFGRGVDPRTPEGYAALDSSLRKALDKWAADNDGSPELFDGVKAILDDPNMSGDERIQAIADAIANAQLTRMEGDINGRQARENAARFRGIRNLLEDAGFETEITRRNKAAKEAEEEALRKQSMPDRRDKGKDFGFPPDKTEEVLRNIKVSALRDENGKRVKSIDPETGEPKSTYAENPDAIMDALLENLPEAPVTETGSIIAARTRFTDPDGTEYVMDSKITRTNGSNYMISFDITDDAGNSTEIFHYDYRDSFSSIFGKTNGIQRMTRILSGEESPLKETSAEYPYYFGSGTLADRLEYFSGSRTKADRDKLVANLAKAQGRKNKYEIEDAEYQLDLLDNYFGGDIEKYRDNSKLQSRKLLTIEQTVDRYANGRGYMLNRARGKSEGTIMRPAVNGIFGAIRDKDTETVTEIFKELSGRMPEFPKHPKVLQTMLDRLRAGAKLRFPNADQRALGAVITNGYNAFSREGFDLGVIDSAPHVSWEGRILEEGWLVKYTGNNVSSVGIVERLIKADKNTQNPNEYGDYALVRFKDQTGRLSEAVKIAGKDLEVLDESGLTPEALQQVTIYTPRLKGDEMREARFGEAFMIQKMARDSVLRMDQMGEIGDGFRPPTAPPEFWGNGNAVPGRYLYDKAGLPLGKIAAVRETTSDAGEDGFSIAYVTPENSLQFIGVKAGENRAPKSDLNSKDGRGSNDSDPGFTPNPADFSDIGLDASSIGGDTVNAEDALIDLVNNSPLAADGPAVIAGSMASLMKVNAAKAAHAADPSDENKEAYKKALTSYYGRIAVLNASAASVYNRDAAPAALASDDILTPDEVASLNATFRATVMEVSKSKPDLPDTAPLTYDEIVDARLAPENTYSGYTPQGWSPLDVRASMDLEKNKHTEVFKDIVSMVGGDAATGISDKLAESLALGLMRTQNVDPTTNTYMAPNWQSINNEAGDVIHISKKGEGYNSTDAEIDTVANVFQKMRDKLNLGDKPMEFAMFDSRDTEPTGALGFVYTRAMWSNTSAYQARAHALMDKLPSVKKDLAADKTPFEPGKSWWAVDLAGREDDLLEYIASHEMGHVMQGEAMRQFGQNLTQETWDKFYGPVAKSHRVSQYGQSNNNEHFAESFVKFLMTGQAHPEFMKFLQTTGLLK